MNKNISTKVDINQPENSHIEFLKDLLSTATEKSRIVYIGENTDNQIWSNFASFLAEKNLKAQVYLRHPTDELVAGTLVLAKDEHIKLPFSLYVAIDDHSYLTIQREQFIGFVNNKPTAAYAAKVSQLLLNVAFR